MKTTIATRLPNLFDLILEQHSKFSINAFVLTYLILPFVITLAVIATRIVQPNGLVAALFLYLSLIYSNGLTAAAISWISPKIKRQKITMIHLVSTTALPFVIWRVWALICFGY